MLGAELGALAVDLGPRIGGVELDVLDVAAGRDDAAALAALLEAQKDLVLDLHVPGKVVFAGLQHGPRRRDGIAAALHLDRVEMRLVVHVVVRIDHAGDHVARLEVLEHVGAGADRLEVGRRVARLGAHIVGIQVLGDDHALGADEGVGPERRRLVELDAHRVVVDLLDDDVLEVGDGDRGGCRVLRIFPVEDDVVGRERLAVVPLHALLQLPGHRLAVGRQGAVLATRNGHCQHRLQVAVGVPVRERFVEQARTVLVLGADREMRIEQGRALPPKDLQMSAAAALGRLVDRLGLRHRHAGIGQELRRHRRRQPHHRHPPDEATPGHPAGLHAIDQTSAVHARPCQSPRSWPSQPSLSLSCKMRAILS